MEHEIIFFQDEHLYLVDGQEVPSVTTILNYMSDAEYGKIPQATLDQAARRGTLVHEYTELMDYDAIPDEIEYEVVGYLKAYGDFLRDYKPDWTHIESKVYSSAFNFVGTVDRAGFIDGQRVIVDIKTVSSPTKMQKFTVCSQTSAYAVALKQTYGVPTQKRYALYLTRDGEYNLVDLGEYEDKYDYDPWQMFKRCLDMYNEIKILKELKPIRKGKKDNGKRSDD